MKIVQNLATRIVNKKMPTKVKRGIAIAAPLVFNVKEAAAHPSVFFHLHDNQGNTIGLAAGILLLAGSLVAGAIALYKSINKNREEVKESSKK